MDGKYFIDTNIFVYSFDLSAHEKAEKADQLIQKALETGRGVVSFQVIQEFLSVATGKFKKNISIDDCRLYLDKVFAPLCEVFPSIELSKSALNIQAETGYSFYDALIIASAAQAGCRTLYTEDLQTERKVAGLTIRNPFQERG